jgi:AcrR family transcriptional regulator
MVRMLKSLTVGQVTGPEPRSVAEPVLHQYGGIAVAPRLERGSARFLGPGKVVRRGEMRGTGERPLRADAKRNRDQILAAAARAFSKCGLEATLEGIAKDACVGIGTLYRHFPTREALIEAAYRSELASVCDAASELLDAMPPAEALRAWMDRYIDYMTRKLGMADALRAVIASGANPYAQSRELLVGAIKPFLEAGAADGVIRADVSAEDVLVSLSGVALAAGAKRDQADRLLNLLMDGLRYRTS